jgi:hypothetical protein
MHNPEAGLLPLASGRRLLQPIPVVSLLRNDCVGYIPYSDVDENRRSSHARMSAG